MSKPYAKINGVPYNSPDEIVAEIDALDAQLETTPSDVPQRAHIESHIAALRDFLLGMPEPTAEDSAPQKIVIDGVEVRERNCPVCGTFIALPADFPEDSGSQQCGNCEGWGVVFTGSKVPGYDNRKCPQCKGAGFVGTGTTPILAIHSEANDVPKLEGSVWDQERHVWLPPPGQDPPWDGADWNELTGGYEDTANVA